MVMRPVHSLLQTGENKEVMHRFRQEADMYLMAGMDTVVQRIRPVQEKTLHLTQEAVK